MNRTARRAAEHAARKADTDAVIATPAAQPEKSEAQLIANRANAKLSTGPKTEAGKSRSSLNAVKTGLTGRVVLLPSEDAEIYQKHLDRFFHKYSPVNDDEHDLVQSIADDNWRLLRIAPLEASIYAIGHDTCAEFVAHEKDPAKREGALLGHIYLTYKKELTNIALQERRLHNQLDKAVTKLEALQKDRADQRLKELAQAKRSLENCEVHNVEPDFADFGFDFSVAEFETFLVRSVTFFVLSGGKTLNFDTFLAAYRIEIAETETEAA